MRLIDADELKRLSLIERDKIPLTVPGAVYELGIEKPNQHGNAMRGGIRKALRCMENCKTVDAVAVVHCKDCASGKGSTYKVCPLYRDGLMKDDDFCSKGERKNEG